MAIIALPFAALCVFIIPKPKEAIFIDETAAGKDVHVVARKARFDWGGTFFQISAIALLVYGLTSSNTKGWKEAGTITTVILGVLLFGVFFWWETRVHPIDALIAPALWKIPNFWNITVFALGLAFWVRLMDKSASLKEPTSDWLTSLCLSVYSTSPPRCRCRSSSSSSGFLARVRS